jgi:Glycoside hydrolase family 44/Divergent InlB B-repeat domain
VRQRCRRTRRCLITALVLLFAGLPSGFAAAQGNPPVTINVDANSDRRLISPNIYGVAFGDATTLADLNVPINRSGGDNTSRYNWLLNADNRAFDWYFESLPYPSSVAGEVGDTFIAQSRSGGAEPMVTIPMVGWVARLGPGQSRLSSFSIAKYGAQADRDGQWFPDAGNGVRTNGQYVTGNDPNDANVPADSTFQLGWMQHLKARWGGAAAGGLRYYLLDNEPSIWFSTHRDVHPTGPTMDEVRDKIVDYARRVKDNDPDAVVVAPEEWGWDGYRWSGYDQQWGDLNGWSNLPDRAAHGGWDYLPWLLDQLRRQSDADGRRLLDVFSVHYYPQGGEFSDVVTSSMQLLRNRSTRSLWDPNYVDQSWIADRVQLVPRLRGWVDAYYPGTRIAVTEYNWGAEGHINGATAQADVLGILGREGVDLAARWTMPAAATPTYKAFKMYRNYDGNRSTFGDTSVRATGPNPDTMAPFAAVRSTDGALTIMVVTKSLSGVTPTTIGIANFTAGASAQAWQLTASNTITRLADLPLNGSTLSLTLPPQSITLIVVMARGPRAPTVTAAAASNVTDNSATLNGLVNPNGLPTTTVLEWGTTTAYGSTTSAPSPGGGTTNVPVAANVSGLAPNTTYHYRVVATNGAGATTGSDTAFTTSAIVRSVTLTVTVLGSGTATTGDGRIDCPAACSATYPAGTAVTLTARPGSGHSFTQWNGACGGIAPSCTLTLSSDQPVTATFSGAIFTDGSGANSVITGASAPGAMGGTLIKAVHVIELRAAIDNLRVVNGLRAFSWTDSTLTVRSTSVRSIHVLELRTALAAVCAVMPNRCTAYTDATLTPARTVIKAVHLNELRANVRALE